MTEKCVVHAPDMSPQNVSYFPPVLVTHKCSEEMAKRDLFRECPFMVAVIGARGGCGDGWNVFKNQANIYAFELDAEECERLNTQQRSQKTLDLPSVEYIPHALWDRKGTQTLYITRLVAGSSLYKPKSSFYERMPDPSPNELVKETKIPVTTLDECMKERSIDLDFIEIDVQGGELKVFQGSEEQLSKNVLGIVSEVSFVELYEGMPLFSEVELHLRNLGFYLFDIDIRRWRRRLLPPAFDQHRVGQTVQGDALFLRDPLSPQGDNGLIAKDRGNFLKLVALAECNSLIDYSLELLDYGVTRDLISKKEQEDFAALLRSNEVTGLSPRASFNIRNRLKY